MLHHISFGVSDLAAAGLFYDAALGALGYRRVFADETAIGYGVEDGEDKFCIKLRPNSAPPTSGSHLAFAAPTPLAVDQFHARGLAAGGKNNGGPGLRPNYGKHYYAGFLIDPAGHNIEAVSNGAV